MNKIVIMGRCTKDPEVRYTPSQKVVTSIVLAVDRPFTNEQGKRDADFIPVVLWGKAAELVGNSCAKGHRLLVEGRLQIRNFDAKDGTKHTGSRRLGVDVADYYTENARRRLANMGKDVPFDESVPF